MASFKIETKNLFKLQLKYSEAAEKFKDFAIKELNDTVTKIELKAKEDSSPARLRILNPNSKYKRTGRLSNSISSTPFNGRYATITIGKGINYAPYVEFGTGSGYGYPYRIAANLKNRIESLASLYKGSGQKNANMAARPFFFNNVNNGRNSLYRRMKSFKP